MLPAWLPDWADDSAYPRNYEDWCLWEWAWAFFRRNAKYQSDYALFAEGLSLGGYQSDSWLMEKWGIDYAPDPAKDELIAIPFSRSVEMPPHVLQLHTTNVRGEFVPLPIDPDEAETMTIRFDVRHSIEKQLKYVEALLFDLRDSQMGYAEKVKAATPKKAKLPLYLRAFDADLTGVGPRAFAGKIFPDKSNNLSSQRSADEEARRAIKTGKELVNAGYKNLLRFG